MARSTLSFFSRLFSSKKKKILEKRGLYEDNGVVGLNQARGQESLRQSSPEGENGFLKKSFAAPKEAANAGAINHKASSHTRYESSGQLKHGYSDDVDAVVSVVKIPERDNLDNIKTADESVDNKYFEDEENNSASNVLYKDDDLEYDSMVLLSKLEQLMIKISDSAVQKSVPLVLNSLLEMANHVVEFAEGLPVSEQKKITLQRLLQRDEKNYKILNLTYVSDERLVVETSQIMNSDNAKEVFIGLSNDLLRLINVYLSANVKAFRSEHIGEQWKTLYTGFFVNLTKSIRNSQADHQH